MFQSGHLCAIKRKISRDRINKKIENFIHLFCFVSFVFGSDVRVSRSLILSVYVTDIIEYNNQASIHYYCWSSWKSFSALSMSGRE